MTKLDNLTDRALEIAGNVGHSIKNNVPDGAIKWVQTGAALGALKTGSRVATKFVRRNPAVAVATAAGAGLLYFIVRRQQKKKALNGAIEGKATRIEAKPAPSRTRRTATRRAPAASE